MDAARHRVAADLRRLRLPAGLPDRAVRPGRQDRHALRGHHRDPGPGPVLPQDHQGPGQGAGPPRRQIQEFVASEAGNGRLKEERALLAKGWRTPRILGVMGQALMASNPQAENGDLRNIYKVGLNTSRLLYVLGDVVCSWLMLRQAEVALAKLRRRAVPAETGLLHRQGGRGPVVRPLHDAVGPGRAGQGTAGRASATTRWTSPTPIWSSPRSPPAPSIESGSTRPASAGPSSRRSPSTRSTRPCSRLPAHRGATCNWPGRGWAL